MIMDVRWSGTKSEKFRVSDTYEPGSPSKIPLQRQD